LRAIQAVQVRWPVEEFHRSFKQLTDSEKCQCRKERSQRNHLACCFGGVGGDKSQSPRNENFNVSSEAQFIR